MALTLDPRFRTGSHNRTGPRAFTKKVVPMNERSTPTRKLSEVVQVERLSLLRWRAWSVGLVNPRYAPTASLARRRAQADLDHEWRTGRLPRGQRRIR